MRIIPIIAAIVIAAWFGRQPVVAAGENSRNSLAFEIFLAGFSVGEVKLTAEFERDRYELTAFTRNTGLLRLLAGFKSRARTVGRLSGTEASPEEHRADNVWVGERRRVRNRYREDGGISVEVVPPPDEDGREAVAPETRSNAIDPLSAGLTASLRAAGPEACRDRIPVFDGRRRYDLAFERVAEEFVAVEAYSGQALRCRVTLVRIAGFSRRPWLPRAQTPEVASLWFAKASPLLPPLPVLLKTDIGLGSVEVRLVSVASERQAALAGDGAKSKPPERPEPAPAATSR